MRRRQLECGSKQGFFSKPEAKRVARSMSARHREAFHLYACSWCRLYHVGHVVPAWIRSRAVRPVAPAPAWAA